MPGHPSPQLDSASSSSPAAPQQKISRIAFVSLGCPKNLVDSEKMLGTLVAQGTGLQLVSADQPADAVIINTCGFLEASKEESLEVIREAIERKTAGEIKRVIVAGCLVQRHRAKLLEWAPGIDAMIGVFDRDHVLEAVSGQRLASRDVLVADSCGDPTLPRYWIAANALQAAKERGLKTVGLTVNGTDGKGVGYFEDDSQRFRLTPPHWAYLRVSEGCNQRCAFCTIPSIRGKMRSKPLERIIAEARQLMSEGAYELNLIGQDTTSYGADIHGQAGFSPPAASANLITLLQSLNAVASDFGGGWMRLMYVYPSNFTDEMIDAIASLPNIVKYIDIPLQHISDRMLSSMRRNITRTQQEDLVYKLRDRIPGLAIRTTFITGFPGETEQDHQELLQFIEEFGFDMLGVFRYSREDGTPAGTMDLDPNLHVPDEVKLQREAELMLTQQKIAFENAAYVAQQRCQFDVLIEGPAREPARPRADRPAAEQRNDRHEDVPARYVGRCYHQAPQVDSLTHIHSRTPLSPGDRVRCTIVDSEGYDLIAQPTQQLENNVKLPILS